MLLAENPMDDRVLYSSSDIADFRDFSMDIYGGIYLSISFLEESGSAF